MYITFHHNLWKDWKDIHKIKLITLSEVTFKMG